MLIFLECPFLFGINILIDACTHQRGVCHGSWDAAYSNAFPKYVVMDVVMHHGYAVPVQVALLWRCVLFVYHDM